MQRCAGAITAAMALSSITKQHSVPSSPSTQPGNTAVSSTSSPAKALSRALPDPSSNSTATTSTSPKKVRTNGYTSLPTSRASSLGSRVPPPTALDILLRWLTEYAIGAEGMPAEMAGNALSLVEASYRRLPITAGEGDEKEKRVQEVRSALRGIADKRKAETPQEVLVRDMAARAAAAIDRS